MRIEIIGNLGHSAEVKSINGRDYLSFDVAPSKGGRDGGETMWVSCLYGNTRVAEWLTKGRQVFVRGDYRDRIYTGRDGTARVDRSVMVTELELLGGGEDRAQNAAPNQNPSYARGGAPAYNAAPAPDRRPAPAPPADDGDDLPF